jgi:hypothetical protein
MMPDNVRRLLEQLRPFARDDRAYGRLYADFHDLIEICEWFLQITNSSAEQRLSHDEIESLLIDLDVKLIDHGEHHLKSLKKEIKPLLEKLAEASGEKKNLRGVA